MTMVLGRGRGRRDGGTGCGGGVTRWDEDVCAGG